MKIETANLDRPQIFELMGAVIAPLPVAFISTIDQAGRYNAAPFSFLAPVSLQPPIICVSIGLRKGQKKDTLKNIEFSRDFVINVVDEDLIKQAVQASADYPSDVDEIREVGLTAIAGEKVRSPRVAEAKVSLECRLMQKLDLVEKQGLRSVVFGEIVMVHVKDELWVDGRIERSLLKTIGRLGTEMYCRTGDIFKMSPS